MSTNEDIATLLKNLTSQNATILKQNTEIKQQICNIDLKVESINIGLQKELNEVKSLLEVAKLEIAHLKQLTDLTEKKLKRNNLFIYGIDEREERTLETIVEFFNTKLEIPLCGDDINCTYRVGAQHENKTRPIIVEFISNIKKRLVFKNISKLKGSSVVIRDDLTRAEQEE